MTCERNDVIVATIWEDTSGTVFARIRNNAGDYLTQADLSGIVCKVYEGSTLTGTPTVTIATSVFDTLQTEADDVRWGLIDGSATGFNFRFTIPASCFPDPGQYLAEFRFTPTAGDMFVVVAWIKARALLSS